MASDTAIARTLAFLHELFPTREITEATLDAWTVTFSDWPDDLLRECAIRAAKEPGRQFFPAPGEIFAQRPQPAIDIDSIRYHIEKLGEYNPNVGWIYPSNQKVQAILGESIATAYAIAGRALFSENETTASIAAREFRRALEQEVKQGGVAAIALPETPKQLTEG